ncbi:CHASE2 domain-containing protein [Colwellia hornerae]|uniref:Adenylate/guanylate cyclase domain-containing protein n=1 Tax=Colwellia hornerae TaxID=89402 RepID=A0A5C6QMT3_9GAMM|nr:adenylate/guanylate cyclase domain-containing protein [Colwellia hornerae]TWX53681.1 adenylate/guanylate cyclase domain-containing protein [Colwellia hornerae]TWX60331.1 adenylate/guanylate cyclase domain-containing protein [Colwellia hornerae]TWX70087.1 adenylate/guanylate cyclase domain-containing protein [Colwellia hornerae]
MISLQFFSPILIEQTVQRLDGLVYDLKIKLFSPQSTNITNIQIVDIDETSLAQIGRMPWSREKFTTLTEKLTQQGALVIAFDILYSEPQEIPTTEIVGVLPQLSDKDKARLTEHFDDDGLFVQAMKSNDVVLANLFHHHKNIQRGGFVNNVIEQSENFHDTNIISFTGYTNPITRFSAVAAGQGFMNAITDFDGIVRRTPLVIEFEKKLYPSLALETFRVYSLVDEIKMQWSQQFNNAHIEGIKVGKLIIPTDDSAQILIPYQGKRNHYRYTSAADLLNGKINDNRFQQAVVFVGTSAIGLADLQTTPVGVNYPGVEIHATVFDALMAPTALPYRPDWWQGAIFIHLLLFALLSLLIYPNKSALFSSIFTLVLIISTISVNLYLWQNYHIDLPIVVLLLQVFVLAVYYIGYGFFNEANRRKVIKTMFAQYVPDAHIDKLLSSATNINLAGERKDLTVMFCDIRNFTAISENMSANELKYWLNSIFSPLTDEILKHDGTIDKYVGDMIMAFWGAPIDDEQHSHKSIKTAFAMLSAVDKLNTIFNQQGKPKVSIGIGINTGEMNVGDMGSDFRRSYTVIGDAVNLASRLEALTKFYCVKILVSEFTQQQANAEHYLLVDKVNVVGKEQAILIYTPLEHGLTSKDGAFQHFSAAQGQYFNKQFELAEQTLQSINSDFAYYALVSIYLSRIKAFKLTPPSENWNGCYQHSQK